MDDNSISYKDTVPDRFGVYDWYVGQYPSSTTWKEDWCRPYFYSQSMQGHAPTNVFPDFTYGEKPAWGQLIPHTPEQGSINPLYLALVGGLLYKALYR